MAGHRNFTELRAKMSQDRLTKIDLEVREIMGDMLLSEIRKLAGRTQAQTAASMGISQPAMSQLESQDDMQVSTLQRIIEALGGTMEIIADLPDGRVSISQFRSAGS